MTKAADRVRRLVRASWRWWLGVVGLVWVLGGLLPAALLAGAPPAYAVPPDIAVVGVEGTDGALWINNCPAACNPSDWTSMGGHIIASPAIVADGASSLLFIVTGMDHRLWVSQQTGWSPLPSDCLDNPAAILTGTTAPYTLTIACEGADGALWTASGQWQAKEAVSVSNFASLGGHLVAGPAIGVVGGTLTYFIDGADGSVWTRTDATGWTPTTWHCLGHPSASDNLFACEGTDHALWESTYGPSGWSSAVRVGGQIVQGPALARNEAAGISAGIVAATGVDGSVWYQSSTGFASLGGRVFNGPAAAAFPNPV